MASHTFKYPTVAGATSTLTFPYADFQGDTSPIEANQSAGQTLGGTPMVDSFSAGITTKNLTVRVPVSSESVTDWTDIETFIRDTVNFGERNFYWTDANETARQVKLLNTDTNVRELTTHVLYTFRLRLI
jgi:hypothetical protein